MSVPVAYTASRYDVLLRATRGRFYLLLHNVKRQQWRGLVARVAEPRTLQDYATLGVADGRAVLALFRGGLIAVVLSNRCDRRDRRPIGRVHVTESGYATLRAWSERSTAATVATRPSRRDRRDGRRPRGGW